MLVPVEKRKLSEVAVEQIRGLIESGGLKPGDKLPTERELGDQLNVSRTSIREALRTLEAIGLTEVRPGRGTFVRDKLAETIQGFGSIIVPPSLEEIEELVEVRSMFETRACVLAAQRALPKDLEAMQAAIDDMERAHHADDIGGMVLADTAFHRAIIAATRNKLLIRFEAALEHQLIHSRRMSLSTKGKPLRSIRRHQMVLDAIKEKDGEWAASIMLDHIKSIKIQTDLLKSMPESGAGSERVQAKPAAADGQ